MLERLRRAQHRSHGVAVVRRGLGVARMEHRIEKQRGIVDERELLQLVVGDEAR